MTLLLALAAHAAQPVGNLDAANAEWVGGWAYDPDHPSAEIAIHVYVDGVLAASGSTTGFRPDVNAAFGLTGNHGFTVEVDYTPFGAGAHQVIVYAIDLDGEGNPGIAGSPATVVTTCTPSCGGRECGADGCGGSCGSCGDGQTCDLGECTGAPEGSLDVASPSAIAGWARDPDWDGPIPVHIYVDGTLVQALVADGTRPDVGAHAFHWQPPSFGAGNHEVVAFALGVDSAGQPDGENVSLDHTPATLTATCGGLAGAALGWCENLPDYWRTRQTDTVMVGDDAVRVGVNTSYGGTIMQLYGPGWNDNLVLEHGGGAVQLSIWGYDPVGGTAWFAVDACDPTPFPDQASCLAAGHTACVARAHAQGSHVSDCVRAVPCGGWTAGAPWNPIQAQGPSCGWLSSLNDANEVRWEGRSLYTRLDAPFHFTSTQPAVPMPMEQWVTPHDGFVEIRYRLTYTGSVAWSPHPQEIPAFFTAPGINAHFYYYDGEAPFAHDAVHHQVGPSRSYMRYASRDIYGHGTDHYGYVREGWWGACDADQDRCITIASFSPLMNEVALQANQGDGSGYLTALGYFPVIPGMVLDWTVYVFPDRWDRVVGGRTVREHIYDLAPSSFVEASCVAQCDGVACGDDGCGGTCGDCDGTFSCQLGQCVCDSPCGDCLGDDGDADGDAVCDPNDACIGDDATGDDDLDGVCNDTDLHLTLSAPFPGAAMTFDVTGAPPGSDLYLLVSARDGTTCHPTLVRADGSPLCVTLRRPTLLGSFRADPGGTGQFVVTVPPSLPSGTTIRAQVVALTGGTGDVTPIATAMTP